MVMIALIIRLGSFTTSCNYDVAKKIYIKEADLSSLTHKHTQRTGI